MGLTEQWVDREERSRELEMEGWLGGSVMRGGRYAQMQDREVE